MVEVISPSDKGNDILDKVAEYFRLGVECVWVIFISQTQVYIYESPTQVRILTRADELYGEPVLPHFRLPLGHSVRGHRGSRDTTADGVVAERGNE